MQKLELVRSFRMEQENEHIAEYRKAFPQTQLTIYQMEMIEFEIHDAKAWKEALRFWAGNSYRPQSVLKMIDYYKQVKNGTVQRFEDTSKVKMRVGAPIETNQVYSCPTCSDTGEVSRDAPDSPVKIAWIPCPKCK